jgi:peptide-N4-(N-acetyl-beta-glucosaminyl)asparagine amidase
MNTQQLWSSLKKKPSWPNPEDSIGQFYGEKQGRLCWRAQGPARVAFSEVAPKIKEYLNSCSDAVPGSDWVTWSIYMIGRSKSTAVPTIMFECFQKGPRKEAMNIVRKSGLLNQHPGIETGHWSFPPNIVFPQQLALTSKQNGSTLSDSEHPLGPQITVQIASDDSVEYRKSTIGGLLRVKGKSYYFTVNHPFSSGHQILPWPSNVAEYDDECEFGENSDADNDMNDETLMDVTSRGSMTPESSSDFNSDDETANSDGLEKSESEDTGIHSAEFCDQMHDTNTKPAGDDTVIRDFPAEKPGEVAPNNERVLRKERVGRTLISPKDLCIWSSVLDYALIFSTDGNPDIQILDNIPVPLSNEGIPFMTLGSVADGIPENASIITMTGSSGLITGTLSGSPSYTRLPGTGAYQEVFTVELNAPIYPGDCGSCVFSSETGRLYGHIIAGSAVTQVAYIVPAGVVFADIAYQIDGFSRLTAGVENYSGHYFDFGELSKHLPRINTRPGSPHLPQTRSVCDNNLINHEPEHGAATRDTLPLPLSPRLKDSTLSREFPRSHTLSASERKH